MTPATIAEGIGFTEGPLLLPSGDVLVTSMSRGLLYRCPLDGGPPQVAAETGGGPNGLALGPDGAVYVAQNGNATMQSRSQRPVSPGIQRLRDGTVEDLVTTGCLAPERPGLRAGRPALVHRSRRGVAVRAHARPGVRGAAAPA